MIIEYNHFEYEQEQQKLTKEKFPITLTHFKKLELQDLTLNRTKNTLKALKYIELYCFTHF